MLSNWLSNAIERLAFHGYDNEKQLEISITTTSRAIG